jgi:hypothetical protein
LTQSHQMVWFGCRSATVDGITAALAKGEDKKKLRPLQPHGVTLRVPKPPRFLKPCRSGRKAQPRSMKRNER